MIKQTLHFDTIANNTVNNNNFPVQKTLEEDQEIEHEK